MVPISANVLLCCDVTVVGMMVNPAAVAQDLSRAQHCHAIICLACFHIPIYLLMGKGWIKANGVDTVVIARFRPGICRQLHSRA